MQTVSIAEAGIGMTYECPVCRCFLDTRQEQDMHIRRVHRMTWKPII